MHAATLRDGGEDVVVKVQKPGVADTLKADLGFLAVSSKILEFLAPSLGRLSLANVAGDLRWARLLRRRLVVLFLFSTNGQMATYCIAETAHPTNSCRSAVINLQGVDAGGA